MPIQARILYYLSERGRRDSLRKGGDGERVQEVTGSVADADLVAFAVEEDGHVWFDLTILHGCDPDCNPKILPPPDKGRVVADAIEWDVVPSWQDLVNVACGFRAEQDAMAAAFAAAQQRQARIAQEFLHNPSARAIQVDRDSVKVGDERFSGDHAVVREAKRRAAQDAEELKQANWATLREWIIRHGSGNQRERLLADVLPWNEAFETAAAHHFKPLESFPLYRRFDPAEVPCTCAKQDGFKCEPKFQSLDATELTAQEWEQFTKIKSAASGATFQFREHRAKCLMAADPEIRRGVIVKFTLGQLTFKREFALTIPDVEVPF